MSRVVLFECPAVHFTFELLYYYTLCSVINSVIFSPLQRKVTTTKAFIFWKGLDQSCSIQMSSPLLIQISSLSQQMCPSHTQTHIHSNQHSPLLWPLSLVFSIAIVMYTEVNLTQQLHTMIIEACTEHCFSIQARVHTHTHTGCVEREMGNFIYFL